MRPGSRIYGNSVAVHQAIRMHQQSHQIAQQNMLRQQMMNRQLLLQAAQQVAATPATVEDIRRLVDISRTAEPQGRASVTRSGARRARSDARLGGPA